MNPPADELELKPEKLEEEKDGGALFHCDLYDADIVHKTAQELLPGLASACVDNTTGGLFKNPASVAVDIRREMVDYLIQRSENYVVESVVLDGSSNAEMCENPYDMISDFIDDYATSKRNFFSKVSGWLLSDRREDKIDDFVQEMEINGFWLLNRRGSVAQTLLKNVDVKNIYHCSMKFKSLEHLEEHKLDCSFRTMICTNEGCNSRFSAAQMDHHDSTCPFKILKCEQNCSADHIMRREMDRHCITICPMKLVKCPFYSVGCQSSIPQCTIEQHQSENLSSHLVYILRNVYKEAQEEDLKLRVEELIKLSSPGQLSVARDARALTFAIKDLEAKLGPLKTNTAKSHDEVKDSADKNEESTGLPEKEVKSEESPISKSSDEARDLTDKNEDSTGLSEKEVKFEESSMAKSSDEARDSTNKNEDSTGSPKKDVRFEESPMANNSDEASDKNEESTGSPNEKLRSEESPMAKISDEAGDLTDKNEDSIGSPDKEVRSEESPMAPKEERVDSPSKCNNDYKDPSEENDKLVESPTSPDVQLDQSQLNEHNLAASVFEQQNLKEPPVEREDNDPLLDKPESQMENSSEQKVAEPIKHEHLKSPIKAEEEHTYSVAKRDNYTHSAAESEESTESTKQLNISSN